MSGDIIIRPVRDDDDLDAINAESPHWLGEESLRAAFASSPDGTAMWVAELDARSVGFASAVAAPVADGYRGLGYVFVSPQARGRGIGRALWSEVVKTCAPERVRGVKLSSDADDDTSQAIAIRAGLRLAGLHLESTLDLMALGEQVDRAARTDIADLEFRLFDTDATDADWRRFHAYFAELMADTPDQAAGGEPLPYEVFRSFLPEPWQILGAWDGERIVGFTAVMVRDREARLLSTMLTGVDREFRGRGLSTAIKARHALYLRDAGWRSIVTQNMEDNAPILASNRTLGFQSAGGLRDLVYDHPTT